MHHVQDACETSSPLRARNMDNTRGGLATLAQLYGEPSIQKIAKAGRVQCSGRMPDNNPAKMVFVSNPAGTRRRGAQRDRWLDQVEQDFGSVGLSRNWRQAAMD